jgi:hypothetical protein
MMIQPGLIANEDQEIVDLINLLYSLLEAATRLPAGLERQAILGEVLEFSNRLNALFVRACQELTPPDKGTEELTPARQTI